jgi:ankyrin repeat protein
MIILFLWFIFIAVRGTHAEIIDYLLKAGSDIHQNGWLGQSAVHTASKFKNKFVFILYILLKLF